VTDFQPHEPETHTQYTLTGKQITATIADTLWGPPGHPVSSVRWQSWLVWPLAHFRYCWPLFSGQAGEMAQIYLATDKQIYEMNNHCWDNKAC